MELIDSHCHIDVAAFDDDRTEVLASCRNAGVNKIIVPGITASSWGRMLGICNAEPGLYPALGLHPMFLGQHEATDIDKLEQRLALEQLVAVGEIGLDYHVAGLDKEKQLALFEAQLSIARDADLPVILHVRKAHDQVLSCLKRIKVKGGTAHAFNGSLEQAQHYIDLGFKLGFGGVLSFERSTRLRKLASELPLSAIVLETDAPDMSGEKYRGQRNSPEYLPEYLHALAGLRDEAVATIAQQTMLNTKQVFGID